MKLEPLYCNGSSFAEVRLGAVGCCTLLLYFSGRRASGSDALAGT
jgi:hypothetical protein